MKTDGGWRHTIVCTYCGQTFTKVLSSVSDGMTHHMWAEHSPGCGNLNKVIVINNKIIEVKRRDQ